MANKSKMLDFNDTFLSFDHLRNSFPKHEVKVQAAEADLVPPFKVTFHEEEVSEENPKVYIFMIWISKYFKLDGSIII